VVQQWKRSGLSRREFARHHRLALPIAPSLPDSPAPTRWAVEVVRPDGFIVRATAEVSVAWIGALCREAAG
jgi:hypothetical protein